MRLCGKGETVVSEQLSVVRKSRRLSNGELTTNNCQLVFNRPHNPRRDNHSANKQRKAVGAVAHHIARRVALGNAEHGGGTGGEDDSRRKVREFEGHDFLPIAIWCASTAAMMFSKPATTMYLVP